MVPSVELCPLYHLDDHDFLPGMFVIDNKGLIFFLFIVTALCYFLEFIGSVFSSHLQ